MLQLHQWRRYMITMVHSFRHHQPHVNRAPPPLLSPTFPHQPKMATPFPLTPSSSPSTATPELQPPPRASTQLPARQHYANHHHHLHFHHPLPSSPVHHYHGFTSKTSHDRQPHHPNQNSPPLSYAIVIIISFVFPVNPHQKTGQLATNATSLLHLQPRPSSSSTPTHTQGGKRREREEGNKWG